MWVITESVNDYNQHGDYFIMAFDNKPSKEEIMEKLNVDIEIAEDLLGIRDYYKQSGDRYNLVEVKSGEKYQH